jgi:5-methylcytosine-specific restriction endonuclease McrA
LSRQSVHVEINPENGMYLRIIRKHADAWRLEPERLITVARKVAVETIRNQVLERAKRDYHLECEYCGAIVTSDSGHMHEKVLRSLGGEVSMDNCVLLCKRCHLDDEHGDRKWGGKDDDRQTTSLQLDGEGL